MSTIPPDPSQYPPGTRPAKAGEPVFTTPPVVPQPVVIQQPQKIPVPVTPRVIHKGREEVFVISHSNFFYWWPVWVVGYIMAVVTRFWGDYVQVGNNQEWIYPGKNPGVIFTLVFFLVILITNVTVRGLWSLVVIILIAFGVLLAAYMNWWDALVAWFSLLSIHMNLGFYVTFSTLLFIVWVVSTFIYDHMNYWRVTPGQVTHEFLIGAGSKSYDTRGMVFEKHRNDLFRHWILGFGSGDIIISTTGAQRTTISIPNVLFVDAKVQAIQQLIAMRPDQFEPAPPI